MNTKKFLHSVFSLKNKTVVLTGSAGLLGTQYSHVLSEAGANVVLVDIQSDKNKKLERAVEVDITNEKEVKELKKQILKKYKKIDVLINNAAFTKKHPLESSTFEKYPLELWDATVATNLRGVFLCCREIGKVMLQQKRGVIVNISSIYGMVGADQRIYGNSKLNSVSSYATTKGGIINLTRFLAAHWHRKNIRVNTLSLGGVYNKQGKQFVKNYTYRTMLGRMASKDEYRGAILFLSSDASSYMTGANLVVDGGWTAW